MTTIHTRQLQQYTQDNLKLATKHTIQIRIQHVQNNGITKLRSIGLLKHVRQFVFGWNWRQTVLLKRLDKHYYLYRYKPQYRGADKSLARPGRKQANVSVRMAWVSFGALPCRKKKNFMTARVSMLLKSRASLTFFRACFFPGRAKDLSARRYNNFQHEQRLPKRYLGVSEIVDGYVRWYPN